MHILLNACLYLQIICLTSYFRGPRERLTMPNEPPSINKKVQVGKDQKKAQSEKDSQFKNRGGIKTKLTIRYLYHEYIS